MRLFSAAALLFCARCLLLAWYGPDFFRVAITVGGALLTTQSFATMTFSMVSSERDFIHNVGHNAFNTARSPLAPIFLHGPCRQSPQALRLQPQARPGQAQELLVLLDQSVLRFRQDPHKVLPAECVDRRDDRKTPTSSGIIPYLIRSCGCIS